jgi:ABC-type transport system involved in cytochrome bd biosynthesis fused ATPase/permease subunit
MENKTVIIIPHRLSTVRFADKVVLMERCRTEKFVICFALHDKSAFDAVIVERQRPLAHMMR